MLRVCGLVLGLLLATISGCTRKEVTKEAASDVITGQVFIVTRNGESIKLGLVTVALLSNDVVRKHVTAKQERAAAAASAENESRAALAADIEARDEAARTTAKDVVARAQAKKRAAEVAVEAAEARAAEANSRMLYATRSMFDDPTRSGPARIRYWTDISDSAFKAEKEHKAEAERWKRDVDNWQGEIDKWQPQTTRRSSGPSAADLSAYESTAYYFEGLPEAIARTQTDADGEFRLQVPSDGEYVLAARAERQALKEEYAWLIRIPDEARKGSKVLLSNETLTTGSSPLSLIHTER